MQEESEVSWESIKWKASGVKSVKEHNVRSFQVLL